MGRSTTFINGVIPSEEDVISLYTEGTKWNKKIEYNKIEENEEFNKNVQKCMEDTVRVIDCALDSSSETFITETAKFAEHELGYTPDEVRKRFLSSAVYLRDTSVIEELITRAVNKNKFTRLVACVFNTENIPNGTDDFYDVYDFEDNQWELLKQMVEIGKDYS